MKGGFLEVAVIISCMNLVLNLYGSYMAINGLASHFLLFFCVTLIIFGLALKFRIPRPSDFSEQSILGHEWGAYKTRENVTPENGYTMKIVAHRACGLDAPENSLSAVKNINKEGITAVELDVRLTSDRVPIVFHDSSLTRMTDISQCVTKLTYEELQKFDISIKHPFGAKYTGEKIPTLDDLVNYCMENNLRMFLDLKEEGNIKYLSEAISSLYQKYPKLYELAITSSFNPILIYNIRSKDPKIICSLAWRPYYYSHKEYSHKRGPTEPRTTNILLLLFLRLTNEFYKWVLWNFGYYLIGISAILLHKDMITWEVVDYWKKKGVRVIAWSVNLPTEKHYFEKILEITYLTDTVINS